MWPVHCIAQRACGHIQKPQIAYCESSILFQCLLHFYLPKSQLEVQAKKMSSTYQTLQCLLHLQQGVGVLFCTGIQMAEVNTEA